MSPCCVAYSGDMCDKQSLQWSNSVLGKHTENLCIFVYFRFEYSDRKFTELTEVLDGIFKLNAPFAKENFFPITRTWSSGKEVCMPLPVSTVKPGVSLTPDIVYFVPSFPVWPKHCHTGLLCSINSFFNDPRLENRLKTLANIYKTISLGKLFKMHYKLKDFFRKES